MNGRSRLALVLALSIGLATVLMLGLPLLYLTVPNPVSSPRVDLDSAGRGIFLVADGETFRLFPRASQLDEPPRDAPRVGTVESVVVATRQAGDSSAYRLFGPSGHHVTYETLREQARGLTRVRLVPHALEPGVYELVLPRESMFGGEDTAYFVVNR